MESTGMSHSSPFLRTYVAVVSGTGLLILAVLAAVGVVEDVAANPATFWLFALGLLVSEIFPISVPHGGEIDEITTSTVFALALLIAFGTGPAALTLAAGSILADMLHGKPAWKAGFNAGQYTLSISMAGWAYAALGGGPEVTAATIGPFFVAALAFFLLNTILTDVALVLSQDVPLLPYLWRDVVFQATVAATLIALSPVVVVAADRNLWLVLLLSAPAVAVYWGANLALENARLVGQLQLNVDHLTELNRMKDDLVAVVSHELRTPLTSIQGYIKTLLQLEGELDDEQRRSFLEAADRQSERLRRLIEQFLVVARLETHVEPLMATRVNLARLCAVVVDELRPRAHGHAFDVRVPPEVAEVETDEAKLHQILSNLVENALKYSPPDTRVTVEAVPSLHGTVITVTDEGGGIPEEMRERIFDRFFQGDLTATRRVGGTGLGLYICRRLAETIGGRIWLARSDAGGSEFSLFVPETPPVEGDPAGDQPQSMTASVWPVSTT
jgi:signal transduction histidine kinase